MSDFLKALKEVDDSSKHNRPWRTCQVCYILSELDDEDRAGLQAVLSNKRVTNKAIASLICDHFGYKVDPTRHRQGNCKGLQ